MAAAVNGSLDLTPIQDASAYFSRACAYVSSLITSAISANQSTAQARVNAILLGTERRFLQQGGLPGRLWWKHSLQATGTYTGYAAIVFPGIYEAIQNGQWVLAQQQVTAIANSIRVAANFLSENTLIPSDSDTKFAVGYIVLIAVGGFFGVAAIVYCCCRKKPSERTEEVIGHGTTGPKYGSIETGRT
jgi:hypothetical protein